MNKDSSRIRSKKVFCDICRCFIQSVSLLDAHNKGKRHQKLWNQIEKKQRVLRCSVFVRGFKKDSDVENDLKKALGTYGEITDIYVDKEKGSYAIVEFQEESSVNTLLKDEHNICIDDHKLVIKPRKPKENEAAKDNKNITNDIHDDKNALLEEALVKCSSVDEQIAKLVEIKQLNEDEIELRYKLCQFLEEIFKEVYHDSKVLPFGSTTSCLGCHGCDLDMTLITTELGENTRAKHDLNELEGNDDDNSSSCSSDASLRPSKELNEICKILRKYAPGCKNVFPMKSAHCPLVKFMHKDSSLPCDLSINNRLAVQNSKLLSSYCDIDIRFRQLSYTVRSWATAKGIAGKSGFQLTKYALEIMMVHFLQQCDPPVLPCLQERRPDDLEEHIIDGWDCYFHTKAEFNSKRGNSLSLGELLVGFFQYFINFDWKTYMVSINTSKRQRKEYFLKQLENIQMQDSFKDGPIWMPDPFELTHNVAHNMTDAGLEALKMELRTALAAILSDIRENDVDGNRETNTEDTFINPLHCKEDSVLIGNNKTTKYDKINLLNLLQPKAAGVSTKKRRRSTVKFIFDAYGSRLESSEAVCRRCATIVLKLLKYDLKMQCSHEYKYRLGIKTSTAVSSKQASCAGTHLNVREADRLSFEEADRRIGTKDVSITLGPMNHSISPETGINMDAALTIEIDKGSDTVTMKRLRSSNDEIKEPPPKMNRLSKEHDVTKDGDLQLENGADLDSVVITVTAWLNTWTKRRQQRRMLDTLKETSTMEEEDHKTENAPSITSDSVTSQQSGRSNSIYAGLLTVKSVDDIKQFNTKVSTGSQAHLQSFSRGHKLNKHVFVAEVKVGVFEDITTDPRCRIVVRLVEAADLNAFHSFFAFFKKAVLQEMGR